MAGHDWHSDTSRSSHSRGELETFPDNRPQSAGSVRRTGSSPVPLSVPSTLPARRTGPRADFEAAFEAVAGSAKYPTTACSSPRGRQCHIKPKTRRRDREAPPLHAPSPPKYDPPPARRASRRRSDETRDTSAAGQLSHSASEAAASESSGRPVPAASVATASGRPGTCQQAQQPPAVPDVVYVAPTDSQLS